MYKDVVVVKPYPDTYAHVEALNTIGGWAQWKYRMTNKIEWNAAMGEDHGLRIAIALCPTGLYKPLRSACAQPDSICQCHLKPSNYLMFSFEYRNIKTWPLKAEVPILPRRTYSPRDMNFDRHDEKSQRPRHCQRASTVRHWPAHFCAKRRRSRASAAASGEIGNSDAWLARHAAVPSGLCYLADST